MPEVKGNWSNDFKYFIKMCLKRNPDERWKINDILFSQFLIDLDIEETRQACKEAWKRDVRSYIRSRK